MLFTTMFFLGMASDNLSDSDSDDTDEISDDISDLLIKIMIPCAVGGALGAFVGFRYLWAQMPATEVQSSQDNLPPLSPPQY